MENRKIRYQFDRLPMVLFIACLAITVVAASHVKTEVPIDNLYSPFYYGDSNVTEGKQFWIRCRAEPPISWFKDGEPIEKQLARHGQEEFMYTTSDHVRDDLSGKYESTLSVSRAVLRHKGKYQCNINHDNAHFLHVHPAPLSIDESFDAFEAENDHDDQRSNFERLDENDKTINFDQPKEYDKQSSFGFEQPIEDDKAILTTMMTFTKVVTESTKFVSSDIESILDYDDEKSHEKFIDEPTIFDGSGSLEYDSTVLVFTTTSSPSLTNIPLHSTHANHVLHTTHEVPSEVQTQNHPEKHRHKGKLTPNYDMKKEGYTLFKIFKPLVLSCKADNPADSEKIIWSKLDDNKVAKNVREISNLNGRFRINSKESSFQIERAKEEDAGNYTCSLGDSSHNFNVYAAIAVLIPKHLYAVEEEKLEIECIVKGTDPDVTWEYRPEKGNESKIVSKDDERVKFSEYKNIPDAKLIIEKANLSDRGYFTCIGKNDLMDDEVRSEGYVRVKDKLAALWPFLGICAEVFVLCAIILIYEKRRNKTDLDESDTDQSPDQKNDQHKDSDVRHRK